MSRSSVVWRVDVRPLVGARQKRRLPVLRFLNRIAAGAHGDETGQILIFAAQAVSDPRAETGPNLPGLAAVHKHERGLVVGHVGMHRANDGNVVDVPGNVGEYLADFDAALAMFLEAKRRRKRRPGAPLGAQIRHRQLPAGVAQQGRLRIEGVDVGRSAIHEEMNDALGLAGIMRRARGQRRGADGTGGPVGPEQTFGGQQAGEAERAESHAAAAQEITTGERILRVHRCLGWCAFRRISLRLLFRLTCRPAKLQ